MKNEDFINLLNEAQDLLRKRAARITELESVVDAKLKEPAQVGGVVFRAGVKVETLVKAAQRNYRYRNDPSVQSYPDRFTLAQIQAMDAVIPQGEREFVTLKDYAAMSKDAERYRWLRDMANNMGHVRRAPMVLMTRDDCSNNGWEDALIGEGLDAAVDAAISASEPKNTGN